MLVASVTRLDAKCEQTVLRESGTRLDTFGRSVCSAIGRSVGSAIGSAVGSAVGSSMGSVVSSDIGRSMGSSIGKGELTFVFVLIENVVRSTVIFFSNYR